MRIVPSFACSGDEFSNVNFMLDVPDFTAGNGNFDGSYYFVVVQGDTGAL